MKKKPRNPTEADVPRSPEFLGFAGNLRQILSVPKDEIDQMLAEERGAKEEAIGGPPS
ncbi:MAG: hypothetical protein ACYC96_06000 [Fimbriimonadaceae bacterium]